MSNTTNIPTIILPTSESFTINHMMLMLMKRKWVILFFSLLVTSLAVYVSTKLTPIYKSSTTVLIENKKSNVLSIEDVVGLDTSKDYLLTEFEILQSISLAEGVVRRLDLDIHPLFDPRQQSKQFNPIKYVKDIVGLSDTSTAPTEQEYFDKALSEFRKGLSFSAIRQTQLVKIQYESPDPELSARIADTVADVYIESQLQAKLDVRKKATNWLNGQLGELKEKLKQSEEALQSYREEAGLVDIEGVKTLDSKELTVLTNRYVEAKANRYEAETAFRQVKSLGRNPSLQQLMGIPGVLQQPLVQNLNQSLARAKQKVAELNKLFGPKHPDMVAAISEADSAENALREQINRVIDSIEARYRLALENENSLRAQISQSKKRFQGINRKEFKLNELEREVETNRQIYDLFFTRAKETGQTGDLQVAHARIVDPARISRKSIKPNKKLIVGLSFILSFCFASGLVLLRDSFDNSFHTIADVEEKVGINVLGKVPLVSSNRKKDAYYEHVQAKKDTFFSEAMRTLRTSFVMSSLDNPFKVCLVTSSVPGEGKSTIALNLAEALGQMEKTLVIDADLRRSSLDKALGNKASAAPGLTDCLAGRAKLEDCIQNLSEYLDFLPAGTSVPNSLELLSGRKTNLMFEVLRKNYDRVIVDTPPVNAVSDAVYLSKYSDSVIYVIRAGSTSFPVVAKGINSLSKARANVNSVVLNGVNKATEKYYGEETTSYDYS